MRLLTQLASHVTAEHAEHTSLAGLLVASSSKLHLQIAGHPLQEAHRHCIHALSTECCIRQGEVCLSDGGPWSIMVCYYHRLLKRVVVG